uniref:Uncharacterized protein n=1 Tax=Physcomitrium patens TaxID=3218 RepID=A0A7I4E1A3_PHYPA
MVSLVCKDILGYVSTECGQVFLSKSRKLVDAVEVRNFKCNNSRSSGRRKTPSSCAFHFNLASTVITFAHQLQAERIHESCEKGYSNIDDMKEVEMP